MTNVIIGERLRALREEKKFSHGDVEKRTGLLRCYISRVENGHTSLDSVEVPCQESRVCLEPYGIIRQRRPHVSDDRS